MINEITVEELKQLMEHDEKFVLIDVREPYEAEIATLGGELIPLGQVPENVNKFEYEDKKVIVHCRSGKRSANAIQFLQENHHLKHLYNLKGGILEWADKIDPSIQKY